MKKCFLVFLALFLLISPCLAYSVPDDTVVYVTDTGTKYHRDGCSYLHSSHPMTIQQAEASGYGPCSRCRPDRRTGEYESSWDGQSSSSSSHTDATERPTVRPTPTPTPEPTPVPVAEPEITEDDPNTPIWVAIPIFFCIAIPAYIIKYRRDKKKYLAEYSGKSIYQEAGVPRWIFIDQDGVPRNKAYPNDKVNYLVVYISRKGKKYHSKGCEYARNSTEILLSEAKRRGIQQCKVCKTTGSPPDWLLKYRRIDHIRKKYKIPMQGSPSPKTNTSASQNEVREQRSTFSHQKKNKKMKFDGPTLFDLIKDTDKEKDYWLVNEKGKKIYADDPEELSKKTEEEAHTNQRL